MNVENIKKTVSEKKDLIVRRALVVGGVLVGTIAAGLLFAKIRAPHVDEYYAIESETEES